MINTIWNKETFEQFIENFDYYHEKYLFKDVDVKTKTEIIKQRKMNRGKRLSEEEKNSIFKTIRYIYNLNDYEANKTVELISKVFDKFIWGYLDFEGVDDLFSYYYYRFEWKMHLGYNFDKHSYNYYRDHYVHQIRNLYEIFDIYNKSEKIQEYIYCWIMSSNSNNVEKYIIDSLDKYIDDNDSNNINAFKKIAGCLKNNESIIQKVTLNKQINKVNIEEEITRYLVVNDFIKSVFIVSSLLHDAGYPLTYAMKTTDEINSYFPNSDIFLKAFHDYNFLNLTLGKSLLFRTVSFEEIKKGLTKYDHGTFSAIILLLYYYSTGMIYSLNQKDRCVIEFSALVIYNHTLHYDTIEKKPEGSYYANVFSKNPISYLFRLCDDIQEWDRTYFNITEKSNIMICNKCSLPIVKSCSDNKKRSVEYKCKCGSSNFERINSNEYRKLTNAQSCRNVSFAIKDSDHIISIDYDLGDLLELSLYNPSFALYRSDEIVKIRRMLTDQMKLPKFEIKSFITYNPIAIKLFVLEKSTEIDRDKIIKKYDSDPKILDLLRKRINCYLQINNYIYGREYDENIIRDSLLSSDYVFKRLLMHAISILKSNYNSQMKDSGGFPNTKEEMLCVRFTELYTSTDGYLAMINGDLSVDNYNFYLDLPYFFSLINILEKRNNV